MLLISFYTKKTEIEIAFFLAIDHMHGDDGKNRPSNAYGEEANMVSIAKDNNFPRKTKHIKL